LDKNQSVGQEQRRDGNDALGYFHVGPRLRLPRTTNGPQANKFAGRPVHEIEMARGSET
jgi:hypothetical protein